MLLSKKGEHVPSKLRLPLLQECGTKLKGRTRLSLPSKTREPDSYCPGRLYARGRNCHPKDAVECAEFGLAIADWFGDPFEIH